MVMIGAFQRRGRLASATLIAHVEFGFVLNQAELEMMQPSLTSQNIARELRMVGKVDD